ncbi:MAG: hypothetical protein DRG11_01210 [Epsilonproteobacteria bacterium]|nr:MAG: hypothetical protein DRG11_01210 [Campylobacterota bacterium]
MLNEINVLNEMLIHVSFTTHQDPKRALVVGEHDANFQKHINFYDIDVVYVRNLNEAANKKYDVVLCLEKIDKTDIEKINTMLQPEDSILCFPSNDVIQDIKIVSPFFWIAMPYHFYNSNAIFASKKYHPQADIRWSVSDMIPDTVYYTSEIQNCSFVYPKYYHDRLTGIAKR